jgi:hypothetical protein
MRKKEVGETDSLVELAMCSDTEPNHSAFMTWAEEEGGELD